ncbi:CHY zinc finger protein [Brevibacterium atlanticum]|uniref:CHY zinc finger protein n=1 Tax=Brevibacterium atlanticum TaxID=2697563 RepID=UPI00141E855D|nr:CHY zinc finger protein [Brevibacterium atlanticum]
MTRSPEVFGKTVDEHTRCVHYATELDIIAIRFACCGRYYPCHLCHSETADHPAQQWPRDRWDEPAIICGNCWSELTITAYNATDDCPTCGSAFNPRCAAHSDYYFAGQ